MEAKRSGGWGGATQPPYLWLEHLGAIAPQGGQVPLSVPFHVCVCVSLCVRSCVSWCRRRLAGSAYWMRLAFLAPLVGFNCCCPAPAPVCNKANGSSIGFPPPRFACSCRLAGCAHGTWDGSKGIAVCLRCSLTCTCCCLSDLLYGSTRMASTQKHLPCTFTRVLLCAWLGPCGHALAAIAAKQCKRWNPDRLLYHAASTRQVHRLASYYDMGGSVAAPKGTSPRSARCHRTTLTFSFGHGHLLPHGPVVPPRAHAVRHCPPSPTPSSSCQPQRSGLQMPQSC